MVEGARDQPLMPGDYRKIDRLRVCGPSGSRTTFHPKKIRPQTRNHTLQNRTGVASDDRRSSRPCVTRFMTRTGVKQGFQRG